ncbi:MAG: hypothetical protein ACI4QT_06535 [Kiritimatiellia bacterium]
MPIKVSEKKAGAFARKLLRLGSGGYGPFGGSRGETLLECVLSMAIAAVVFVPAGAAFRNGMRLHAQNGSRLREALLVRPYARTLATRYWLGETPDAFSFRLAPVRMEARIEEPDGDDSPKDWKYGRDLACISVESPLASRVLYVRNALEKRPDRTAEE